jgi:hypothetical protein
MLAVDPGRIGIDQRMDPSIAIEVRNCFRDFMAHGVYVCQRPTLPLGAGPGAILCHAQRALRGAF